MPVDSEYPFGVALAGGAFLAALALAADGVDRRFVVGAALVALTSYAMLRLDPATGAG
jgi:hypothetical protein